MAACSARFAHIAGHTSNKHGPTLAERRAARTAHLLDGDDAAQRVQVGIREPGEFGLHGLQQVARHLEARVRAVVALRSKAHRRAVGAAGVGRCRSTRVYNACKLAICRCGRRKVRRALESS